MPAPNTCPAVSVAAVGPIWACPLTVTKHFPPPLVAYGIPGGNPAGAEGALSSVG